MKIVFNEKNDGRKRYRESLKDKDILKEREKYSASFSNYMQSIVTVVLPHCLYRTTREKSLTYFKSYRTIFEDVVYKPVKYVEAEPINIAKIRDYAWSLINNDYNVNTNSGYHKTYSFDDSIVITKCIGENIVQSTHTKEWFASLQIWNSFYNFYYAKDGIMMNKSIVNQYQLKATKCIIDDSYFLVSKDGLSYEQFEELIYAEYYGGRYAKL